MCLSRWSTPRGLGWLLLAGLSSGCPAGKDPPAMTALIALPATGPAGFTLGAAATRCADASSPSELDRCDSGKGVDALSWVPRATAVLAPFWIDEHEVTNLQYSHCVDAGKCAEPAFADIEGTPYYGVPDFDDAPVVFVTRQDGRDYCAFAGKRLPNEAEWEWAARYDGDKNDRTFPYTADNSDPLLSPDCNKSGPHYLVSKGCATTPLPVDYSTADVTTKGVRNMASNVAEWVEDDWNAFAYCEGHESYESGCMKTGVAGCPCETDGDLCAKSCAAEGLALCKAGTYAPQTNPGSTVYLVRGGSYKHSRCALRLFARRAESRPAGQEIGFRCASVEAR